MRRFAVVLVALAAAPLAGCGGGDDGESIGKPPREYAGAICTAVGSWLGKITDRTAELQGSSEEIRSDLEKGRSLIVTYLDDVVGYSDDLVSEVEAADKPDLEHGEAIAGEIHAAVLRARTGFVDAREEARNLPTDDPAAFQRETQELGATLTREGQAIEQALDGVSERYDANELDQAFDNEPSCTRLAGQTS
jgi:hypothetical protein